MRWLGVRAGLALRSGAGLGLRSGAGLGLRSGAGLVLGLLAGCAPTGTWAPTASGGSFIETGEPSIPFADGCGVVFSELLIAWGGRFVEGPGGDVVAEIPGAAAMDLVPPGPHALGEDPNAEEGDWGHLHAIFAPDSALLAGNATAAQVVALDDGETRMLAAGTITCGASSVTFRWSFDRAVKHHCYGDVPIAAGERTETPYLVAGERLFQPALQAPASSLVGQPFVDADTDGDGVLTVAELDAVSVVALQWPTATWSGVDTLFDFLTVQTMYVVSADGTDCTPEIL